MSPGAKIRARWCTPFAEIGRTKNNRETKVKYTQLPERSSPVFTNCNSDFSSNINESDRWNVARGKFRKFRNQRSESETSARPSRVAKSRLDETSEPSDRENTGLTWKRRGDREEIKGKVGKKGNTQSPSSCYLALEEEQGSQKAGGNCPGAITTRSIKHRA